MNLSAIIFSIFLSASTPKATVPAVESSTISPETSAVGDLYSRITRLEEQNRSLQGRSEELEHRIKELQKHNENLSKQLAEYKKSVDSKIEANSKEIKAQVSTPKIVLSEQETTLTAETKPSSLNSFSSPNTEFDLAFNLMSDQKLDEARTAFENFTKKYPNSSLSGEAYYWLGEMNFDEKDYNNAAINYLKGYRDYPKGAKAAENILKLALTLNEVGKKAEACQNLARFNTEFKNAHANLRAKAANKRKEIGCS